jgi:hypothetical protein
MRESSTDPFDARAYVDTGPVQERVYAQHAGIGWIGKNTCVINPDAGSWIFLAEILCSLPLECDRPAFDQCGTCTLCCKVMGVTSLAKPHYGGIKGSQPIYGRYAPLQYPNWATKFFIDALIAKERALNAPTDRFPLQLSAG